MRDNSVICRLNDLHARDFTVYIAMIIEIAYCMSGRENKTLLILCIKTFLMTESTTIMITPKRIVFLIFADEYIRDNFVLCSLVINMHVTTMYIG